MSNATGSSISLTPPPAGPVTPAARHTPPRSWLARVVLDTVGRIGAKVGLVWIATITFCAVFAPMLANSHPFLLKMDGRWSSPMLQHLTPTDVTLLVSFAAAVTLWAFKPLRFAHKLGALLGVAAVTLGLSLIFVTPPKLAVLEQYRQAIEQGRVEWAVWAPVPYSPNDRQRDRFTPGRPHPWEPSREHPLGTERNGADILSRMVHASRNALAIGFIAEGLSLLIGVSIGGLMGYFAGPIDLFGMRLVEVFSSIPRIYLLLTFVAFFGRNLYLIMVIIGLTSWVGYALFTRAEFLRLRQQDFVQAAIACGLPLRSILFRHMLPNGMAPVLVNVSFGVASAILAESTLSFLGLGLVDEPSWGELLNQALSAGGGFHWWLATFPGLAIFLTVCAYNLIGESARDAIDPHLKRAPV
jgi:peptide/nickel transport system permease protein